MTEFIGGSLIVFAMMVLFVLPWWYADWSNESSKKPGKEKAP